MTNTQPLPNANGPFIFKVFSLHRYFAWCAEMREHYLQVGMQVAPTPSFFENENAGRAFMYLSYWYAGLFVVSEGWKELKLSDPEINALLKSPHLNKLRRFRHGVYHFQPDYFDQRFMDALALGKDFDEWAESLMLAFARYFDTWIKCQTAALSAIQLAGYPAETELI
jgi:hypothetical protein